MPPQSSDSGSGPFGYRAPPPPRRSWLKTLVWIAAAVALAVLAGWALTMVKAHNDATAAANGGGMGGPPGGPGGPGGGGGRGGGGGGRGGGGGAPTTVGLAKATLGAMPITTDALGTVTPLANVTVLSRVSGTLDKVYFTEGQMVRKGQRLALIDPRPYQVALDQAKATLAHDQAVLQQAVMDYKRYETLLAQDSIARQTADDQASLVKQDEGTVAADKANVANAQLNLAYCSIDAPATGRVGLRKTDPGTFVVASSTAIVVVTTESPIDVEFALPEDELPAIQARLHQGAKLPVDAYDRARVNVLAKGLFSTLDNEVATTTGTVSAKARFANADGALFPNQFVNVHILVDTLQNVVIVPTSSVRHGAPGDFVYTVANHTAHVTVVKLGPSSGESIAVLSGLNPGDSVVTEGGDRLRDGGAVLLPGDCPPSGGARGGVGGGHRHGSGAKPGGAAAWGGGASGGRCGPSQTGGAKAVTTASTAEQGAPSAAAAGTTSPAAGQGGWNGQGAHGGSSRGAWAGHHRAQQGAGAAGGDNP
jgi:multidrug efflux system membrane fusion protein